jgi:hypothetical protein
MATFPLLSTGAVAQYPVVRSTDYGVEIIDFLDGTDQRCLIRGKRLRRWRISLDLLTEAELEQIETFFDSVQGDFARFTFTDPFTGEAVPNCRLGDSSLTTEYIAEASGKSSLWIEETNG